MVIDNDANMLEMMQEALRYEGYEVETFTGTKNIFARIKAFKPDLLIIDYILDGINGGEYCRQVKNNPATSALPIMMFSGLNRVIESLGNYGCDAFLAKPFNLAELTNKVKQLTDL